MKSAFVTIIGRPSAGKSTFLNYVCGNKVSIVSPVPQTTRNKIRGIYNHKDQGQLIFLDTPGFNVSDKKFNNYLKKVVSNSLFESDLVLYIIDSTREPGDEENCIVERLKKCTQPVIIALNKIDQPKTDKLFFEEYLASHFPGIKIFHISGIKGTGIKALLDHLVDAAPQGPAFYPADYYTDQEPEFRIAEIIREKAMNMTREEVPHSIYIEICDMEMQNENLMWVRAFINVERDSQKGIVVGKGGQVIKSIREQAKKELDSIFPYKVHLDLQVKVKPNWRKNDALISKMIQ